MNSDIFTLTIGGTTAGTRNIISGNFGDGITLLNTTNGASAVVQDNIVGLDVSGTKALGNAKDGINSNVLSTTIGGPNPSAGLLTSGNAGNLVSGNRGNGITIGSGVMTALAQGNIVGLDVTGMIALANAEDGINSDAATITIGGSLAADRNVVSANLGNGITLGSGVNNTAAAMVLGNYVGVNAAGTGALGNKGDGVRSFALNTTIGGTSARRSISSPAISATGSPYSTPPRRPQRWSRGTSSAWTRPG